MKNPILGVIADDFTGATDVAGLIRRSGMSVVQCFGIPGDPALVGGFDVVVVALKSRSIPADQACKRSCEAAKWLESLGTRRFFFKYCSTFDSTGSGNIGPVAEALMDQLDVAQAIFCPSFPQNGRTVYRGHLFVGDQLLSECGMQHHPLNPMTDANLLRVLQDQSRRRVGLAGRPIQGLAYADVLDGLEPLVIADAIDDQDLRVIAEAVVDHRLVTGGSAIAGMIAETLVSRGDASVDSRSAEPIGGGEAAVLAGSCSEATRAQVQEFVRDHAWLQLDVQMACDGQPVLDQARAWIASQPAGRPFLVSTTTSPEELGQIQSVHGRDRAASVAEHLLGEIGADLVSRGFGRLVIAGGETSGAIVERLGIEAIRIGDEIAPGVPWTESIGNPTVALALKSGNFGAETFFRDALAGR